MNTKMHLNALSLRAPFLMDDQPGLCLTGVKPHVTSAIPPFPRGSARGGGDVGVGGWGGVEGVWHDPI